VGGGEEREREREGEGEEREEREKLKLKVETLDTLLREERDSRLSTLSATPQREERELGTTRRWRRTTAAAPPCTTVQRHTAPRPGGGSAVW
jgi:hypothetical protein